MRGRAGSFFAWTWGPRGRSWKKVAQRPLPELVAEDPERAGRVAEAPRRLRRRDLVDEVGPQRLVLALPRLGRLPEEARRVCYRIWCRHHTKCDILHSCRAVKPILHDAARNACRIAM